MRYSVLTARDSGGAVLNSGGLLHNRRAPRWCPEGSATIQFSLDFYLWTYNCDYVQVFNYYYVHYTCIIPLMSHLFPLSLALSLSALHSLSFMTYVSPPPGSRAHVQGVPARYEAWPGHQISSLNDNQLAA
jgi:hypothetical protein